MSIISFFSQLDAPFIEKGIKNDFVHLFRKKNVKTR